MPHLIKMNAFGSFEAVKITTWLENHFINYAGNCHHKIIIKHFAPSLTSFESIKQGEFQGREKTKEKALLLLFLLFLVGNVIEIRRWRDVAMEI